MCGKLCQSRGFPTTPQEAGVRERLTNCWHEMGVHGARWVMSGLLDRLRFRKQWGGPPRGRTKTMTTQTRTAVMPKTGREVRILADANTIAQMAAAEFVEAAREPVCAKGASSVALEAESTSPLCYRRRPSCPSTDPASDNKSYQDGPDEMRG